jgi:hypothetical protein
MLPLPQSQFHPLHWNLVSYNTTIICGTTDLLVCYLPAVFFLQLRIIALSHEEKFGARVINVFYIFSSFTFLKLRESGTG